MTNASSHSKNQNILNPIEPQGFLLVNKPSGMSSFAVVKKCRYLTGVKKVGHAGTLDPFATGLLLIAIGKPFTKQLETFVSLDKTYTGVIEFGRETDSYDVTGELLTEAPLSDAFTLETILAQKDQFTGLIDQVPPIFSAKKVNGKRSYALARKGEKPDLKSVQVNIHDLSFSDFQAGDFPQVSVRLTCSKGTYVRSIAHDLGKACGTVAYLKSLTRDAIGDYSVSNALDFDALTETTIRDALFTS